MLVGMPLLQVFDRMGCGGLIVSTTGHVLAANATARHILQGMFNLDAAAAADLNDCGRDVVKHLLTRGRTRIRLDSENWILIERDGQRPLIMNAVPVPVLSEDGPDHAKRFYASVLIAGTNYGHGEGRSKKVAEQAAAAEACIALGREEPSALDEVALDD